MKNLRFKRIASFSAALTFAILNIPSLSTMIAHATDNISEIHISSTTTSVTEGALPAFEAQVVGDSIGKFTIGEYGTNTGWSKWETGYESWHGISSEELTAVNDGSTHYALRLQLDQEEGYNIASNPTIYFNGNNITNSGHTMFNGGFNWGGYLYVDLSTANAASPQKNDSVVVHTVFNGEGGTYRANYTPDAVAPEEIPYVGQEKSSSGFFTVASGNSITLTATASENYVFKGWYLTNADQSCSLTAPITCQLLTSNPTYEVIPQGYPYYAPVFELSSNQFNVNDYSIIEIGGDPAGITEADGDDDTITVSFSNGSITVTGTNLYSNTALSQFNTYEIYALGDVTLTATANEGFDADLRENGELLGSTVKQYNGLIAGTRNPRIDGEFIEQGGDNPPNPQQDYEDIEFSLHWTNTFVNVWINNQPIIEESQDFEQSEFVYNNVAVENAGYTNSEQNNTIRLQNRFGDLAVAEFNINGVVYTEESENVTISDEGWFITVPGATAYTISGVGDENSTVPRTIIWANVDADHNAEDFDEDMLLEHGRAKVIAIYDGEIQVADEIDVDEDTGMGWVQVTPGNQVIFEFVPEYGYQLTSVEANGIPLEPQDIINQYVFEMPNTNIHFAATFERTEDIVKADSEKVTGGSITLGNALDGGSAQLTVSDVQLSPDKIAGFKNAAGDYTISNYLDIDLYNVYYKGKNDADDVWSDKIDELEEEATITIKLAEGINADDIVIVHNVHDGEEYEIIEIDSYDPATNTITFKTKSFSNYAIALRDTETTPITTDSSENESAIASSPDSGASTAEGSSAIMTTSAIAIISAVFATVALAIFKEKR